MHSCLPKKILYGLLFIPIFLFFFLLTPKTSFANPIVDCTYATWDDGGKNFTIGGVECQQAQPANFCDRSQWKFYYNPQCVNIRFNCTFDEWLSSSTMACPEQGMPQANCSWSQTQCSSADRCYGATGGGGTGYDSEGRVLAGDCNENAYDGANPNTACVNGGWYKSCCSSGGGYPNTYCSNGSCPAGSITSAGVISCSGGGGGVTHYKCSGSSCVVDANGPYTSSDCNSSCTESARVDSISSFSCSGDPRTLYASWSGSGSSSCNIYVTDGSGNHQISTSCSGSGTYGGSPGGGPYILHASDGTNDRTQSATCPPKYGCSGSSCVVNNNSGGFDSSDCNNTCNSSNPWALLSSGCSGTSPTLRAQWGNIGSGTCNIGIRAGGCFHQISTSCSGDIANISSLGSCGSVVNSGGYSLEAWYGNDVKASEGETAPNCSSGGIGYCGDGSCNNGETCSVCPGDCGSCVNPPAPNCTVNSSITCNTDVNLGVLPNPASPGNSMNFSVTSGDASTCVNDAWTQGSVTNCGPGYPTRTCTAQNPGANYVWTHYWQKCEGALNNCSPLCSKAVNFNIIPPQPTTLYNAACPAPGTATTLSWSRSPGADRYILNVQGNSYNLYDSNPSDPAAFTTSFTGNPAFIAPGNTYTWGVQACKGGFTSSTCSTIKYGTSFTCQYPACPDGAGTPKACGNIPGVSGEPSNKYSIGTCSGNWKRNPGNPNRNSPGTGLPYDGWCATNVNSTRAYCYSCDTSSGITPWIQILQGDVHSNTGINAPGGP